MTLVELRASLRRKIGNPTVAQVSDATLTEHINSGYRDLSTRYRFHSSDKRCTFATAIGTARYQLPEDVSSVMGVRDETNFRKLTRRGKRGLQSLGRQYNSYPRAYTRVRNYIELDPSPSSVLVIEVLYKAAPPPLVADIDEPVIPTEWSDGILMRARWYYYDEIADLAKATYALNAFQLWVSDKPSEVEEELADADQGVEIPTLERAYGYHVRDSRYDDGTFDYRE